jgi:hypothetical protein
LLIALSLRVALHGLEYEDAFEYVYSGWFLALPEETRSESLNPICLLGSIEECSVLGSLPHPIGLSVPISWLVRWFGPSLAVGQAVSGLALAVTALALFVVVRVNGGSRPMALVAALLWLSTPSFFALGATSLSEPVSACLLLVVLLCSSLHAAAQEAQRKGLGPLAVGIGLWSALILAALVRRENLALVALAPVGEGVRIATAVDSVNRRSSLLRLATACGLAVLCFVILAPDALLGLEAVQTEGAPVFALTNLWDLGPRFLGQFLSFEKYSALPYAALVGMFWILRTPWLWPTLGVVAVYALIFSSFSQGYDYVVWGAIPEFHFQRYSVALGPCLALLGGLGVEGPLMWARKRQLGLKRWQKTALGLVVMVIVTISLVLGWKLREELAEEEHATRVEPYVQACRSVSPESILVTGEPVLVSLFCGPSQAVVDFASLGGLVRREDLQQALREQEVFLFGVEDDLTALSIRYPEVGGVLASFQRKAVKTISTAGWKFELWRLLPTPGPSGRS